eukprot:TRINITY_DN6353_c0_g1_i4.p2 TRINITY_DN6353_c0_g1~~TRINITY_DN6353_c0_g1_i4.p2  ORF type:complete len:223 (+),score=32.05 TRINITY_DN6353_c0_g1_i4:62-670(+)
MCIRDRGYLLPLILAYPAVSYLLLKFTGRFWRRRTYSNTLLDKVLSDRSKILHISHRGGSWEDLENTLEAFHHAVKAGTHMLEMDVYMTKDKKVIVYHDPTTYRVSGIYKHIRNYNYDELPPPLPKVRADFDPNITVDTTQTKYTLYPLLETVFQEFPNTLINVELKEPTEELIAATHELIEKYNRKDRTVRKRHLLSLSQT